MVCPISPTKNGVSRTDQVVDMSRISALVVDDHELFRGGLKLLLQDLVRVDPVLEVGNFEDAHTVITDGFTPDLVTFDLNMPGLSGLEGLGAIVEALPAARVVVVTASEKREDILGALGAGAHGYVPKSMSSADIADALCQVLAGRIYAPSALHRTEKAAAAAPASELESIEGYSFTTRQKTVLNALLTGASTRKIANELSLAEGTVKIHLAAIYRILGVHSRAEAIAKLK